MSDMTIKEKLTAALREPPAPPGLVEQTVVRAQAIVAGREAEQQLESDSTLSRAEQVKLAAQSVVGRLMLKQPPPTNATADTMCRQLQENEAFCRLADQPPKALLAEVRNGAFLRKLGEQMTPQNGKAPSQQQPNQKIIKGNNGPTL